MEKLKVFITAKNILIILIILLVITFAIVNFETVKLNFLFFSITVPMIYEIIVVGLIGLVCGYFIRGKK
ncbi:hypothetical protein [Lactococcus garvieae]|uniref:hypothetical protein n=1 Tax=Lactococcus garvieae TaxID=1363 RepID=UPI003853F504